MQAGDTRSLSLCVCVCVIYGIAFDFDILSEAQTVARSMKGSILVLIANHVPDFA